VQLEPGTVMYASAAIPESITDAREYIKRMGLTADDVRLIKKDGQVLVVTKRRIWECAANTPSP